MISRKRLLIVFLSVCGFTIVYLYYVKQARQASIAKYFSHPQLGDIYKMRKDTRAEGVTMFYLRIKDIGEQSIYFYPSRMQTGAVSDVFLNHFDTTGTEVYTKKELAEIVAGKWMVQSKNKTELLEIERK
ncbi:MAG: hypothetical protein ABJB86_19900 [Bacteroidota bacterium]